jgi:hypothetical protein
MEEHAVREPSPRPFTVKVVKTVKVRTFLTRGLAAAFGGTTNKKERERESPGIEGLSRSRSFLFVVSPA